jgi:hypothetical protein
MLIYRSKNQCYLININFIEVVLKFLHQNPQVSTIDQSLNLQLDALNEFGCDEILQEKVSGAKATGVSAATIYRELKKSKISRFALFVFILYIMDF